MTAKTSATAAKTIGAPGTCKHCREWAVGPEDLYCGNCGELQIGLEVKVERPRLVESIATGRQTTVALKNSDPRHLRVEVRPQHQRTFIRHEPSRFELPKGAQGTLTLTLDPEKLPSGFRRERLSYLLVVNGNENITKDFVIEVLAGPRPLATTLDFGQLREGQIEERKLQLTNAGGIPFVLEAVVVEGSGQLVSRPQQLPLRVEAGRTVEIPVIWDTSRPAGEHKGDHGLRLSFRSGGTLFVPVLGSLYRYHLTTLPPRLQLEGPAGEEVVKTFELRNEGTVEVEIAEIRASETWLRVSSQERVLRLRARSSEERRKSGESHRFEVRCNTAGLDLGLHQAQLEIVTGGGFENLKVPVVLRVVGVKEYSDYIGIDFGTTNSVVAVLRPGKREIELVEVADPEGGSSALIPSVLVFTGDDGSYVIGQAARRQMDTLAGRTVRSIKRIMGYAEGWVGPDRIYQPEELAALILDHLVQLARQRLHDLSGSYYDVRRAIVTVPASFYALQTEAILKACEQAGIEVDQETAKRAAETLREKVGHDVNTGMILDEPSAAALFLLMHLVQEKGLAADLKELAERETGMHLLVFDYGGGTLDISVAQVVPVTKASFGLRILASCGDSKLGGDHLDIVLMRDLFGDAKARFPGFDATLIEANHGAIQKRREDEGWSDATWGKVSSARQQWKDQVELLKIRLSDDEEASVDLPLTALGRVVDGEFRSASDPLENASGENAATAKPFELAMRRPVLEERLKLTLQGCDTLLERALELAGIGKDQVDFVFHAGRQSLMPAVQAKVAQFFPAAAAANRILFDKELIKVCVAKGAAHYGRLKFVPPAKGGIRLIEERRLPHAYGFEDGGLFGDPEFTGVIPRQTTYPTEEVPHSFDHEWTAGSGRLVLHLLQNEGSSTTIHKNPEVQPVGWVEHPASLDPGESVEVRFSVDANRRLLVRVDDHPLKIHPPPPSADLDWMG